MTFLKLPVLGGVDSDAAIQCALANPGALQVDRRRLRLRDDKGAAAIRDDEA